jgi:hypothetical protein
MTSGPFDDQALSRSDGPGGYTLGCSLIGVTAMDESVRHALGLWGDQGNSPLHRVSHISGYSETGCSQQSDGVDNQRRQNSAMRRKNRLIYHLPVKCAVAKNALSKIPPKASSAPVETDSQPPMAFELRRRGACTQCPLIIVTLGTAGAPFSPRCIKPCNCAAAAAPTSAAR